MTSNSQCTADMSVEIWRPVVHNGVKYQGEVSNYGRVRSIDCNTEVRSWNKRTHIEHEGQILTQTKNYKGYFYVKLIDECGDPANLRTHRLVATAFCVPERAEQDQVDHIDGDKSNNRADNLRWCTQAENLQYAQEMKGNSHPDGPKPVPVKCLDTGVVWDSIIAAARWASGNDHVDKSGLTSAMKQNKPYYDHVFVRVSDLDKIEDEAAYVRIALATYRSNTPDPVKGGTGKKKKRVGWDNHNSKLNGLLPQT